MSEGVDWPTKAELYGWTDKRPCWNCMEWQYYESGQCEECEACLDEVFEPRAARPVEQEPSHAAWWLMIVGLLIAAGIAIYWVVRIVAILWETMT